MSLSRYFYLGLGWLCVILGGIGIFIPVLPTTPFLLLAVWAFRRSSPALAAWLRNHPSFGHIIRHWQDHGVMPVKAKVLAPLMMAGAGFYLVRFSGAPAWAAYMACATLAIAGAYVIARPSLPPLV